MENATLQNLSLRMGSHGLLQIDHSMTHRTPDVHTCTYCTFSR